jgi:hypothetical protein
VVVEARRGDRDGAAAALHRALLVATHAEHPREPEPVGDEPVEGRREVIELPSVVLSGLSR